VSPPPPPAPRGPTLRLVCVNDVYTLENLPRLRTLVKRARDTDPADVLLTTLAGDFVGPSVLGSLDGGRGMVDCMNAVPITHVVLGNHEDDVGPDELRARIHDLTATVLSTNVLGFDAKMPTAQVVDVGAPGTRRVQVGLVGVVMDDAAVYRRAPFGGATLLPANEAAKSAAAHLVREEGCACVVPITHQGAAEDRALAVDPRFPPFPVVVGGHEHTVTVEAIPRAGGETWLVKAGSDAVHAVVVDLAWPAEAPPPGEPDMPSVTARLVDTAGYDEDPALRARVDGHMRAVRALENATLFTIAMGTRPSPEGAGVPHTPHAGRVHLAPGEVLSSVGARRQQTSLGALLCSLLRDALGADACVMNGGGVRGAKDYPARFTYGDLETEVPFENELVVASIPGRVLREAITASRAHAPAESGSFLQVDDGMTVEGPGARLSAVRGAPLDEARDYRVALVRNLFEGMDHIEPLVRLAREEPSRVPEAGSGRDIKLVLVEAFSRALCAQFGSFDQIDEDHDGFLDAAEIADAIARATREPASPITVELLMKAFDADHDGRISPEELLAGER
jgi:2',3'-cyclic-nucleotide 2'-phosphodiesterase (5'-nucleotidase family)